MLIVEIAVFAAINPEFLSILNISNTLTFTVELGLIALAMTLLMTAGEFDLSVGSLFGFAPVLMWTLYNSGWTSLNLAFLTSLVVAARRLAPRVQREGARGSKPRMTGAPTCPT